MARDAEKLAAQGDRIRELRKFARVSQEIAAAAIGVTLRGYQRWERGEGELKPDNIKKLAAYYATTPDYIEYGERERGPTPDLSNGPTQLDRIEQLLIGLDEQVRQLRASVIARDAEELQRSEEALRTTRPSRRRQQQ